MLRDGPPLHESSSPFFALFDEQGNSITSGTALIVFVEEPCADIMSGTRTYPLTNRFCVHIQWDKAALTPILVLEFSQPGSTNLSQNIEDGGQMVDWS